MASFFNSTSSDITLTLGGQRVVFRANSWTLVSDYLAQDVSRSEAAMNKRLSSSSAGRGSTTPTLDNAALDALADKVAERVLASLGSRVSAPAPSAESPPAPAYPFAVRPPATPDREAMPVLDESVVVAGVSTSGIQRVSETSATRETATPDEGLSQAATRLRQLKLRKT